MDGCLLHAQGVRKARALLCQRALCAHQLRIRRREFFVQRSETHVAHVFHQPQARSRLDGLPHDGKRSKVQSVPTLDVELPQSAVCLRGLARQQPRPLVLRGHVKDVSEGTSDQVLRKKLLELPVGIGDDAIERQFHDRPGNA